MAVTREQLFRDVLRVIRRTVIDEDGLIIIGDRTRGRRHPPVKFIKVTRGLIKRCGNRKSWQHMPHIVRRLIPAVEQQVENTHAMLKLTK